MDRLKRIALVMEAELAYSRGVLRGILKYAVPEKPWLLHRSNRDDLIDDLRTWKPDGVIGRFTRPHSVKAVAELGVPVVNTSGLPPESDVPRVGPDDLAVGAVAAAHFLERGFRALGFIGFTSHGSSDRRETGFRRALAAAGIETVHTYKDYGEESQTDQAWQAADGSISRWARTLPKPIGVFACTDKRGRELSEACRQAGLRVPEDVALLGCDNDDLICRMCYPALSSVELPAERIGFEAAALLDRLMAGEAPPREPTLLPVGGVAVRPSSDVLAIGDADVAAAVRYIRAHAGEWIGVRELLLAVPVNRRTLERKFRSVLGRSPLEEIRRVRLEVAKELLANTDLPMPIIARRAGFSEAKQLSLVFHEEVGTTPTAYRRQFRIHMDDGELAAATGAGEQEVAKT